MLPAALEAHLAEESRRKLSPRTIGEKRALYRDFIEVFGDVPLDHITADEIAARWRIVEFERPNGKHEGKTLSPGRLEKRRTFLQKFFTWAKKSKLFHHAENPLGTKMFSKREIEDATEPFREFTDSDLKILFGPQYV